MIYPQQNGGGVPRAARDQLARFIRRHIARGNEPDYDLAQKLSARLNEMAAKNEPSGLTESEIDELARDLCGRRNILKDWPVVRIDELDGG